MTERKDVRIQAVAARIGVRAPAAYRSPSPHELVRDSFLFDPERPHMGPNELAKEIRDDPSLLQFNCPFCHKSMQYQIFVAHLNDTKEGKGCLTRWFKTVDITKRRFPGASMGDSDE